MAMGIARFFIQFLRDDHGPMLLSLDQAQWFSLIFVFAGVLIWFFIGRLAVREAENLAKVSLK